MALDAEEALVWLDDATTTYPHMVTLQGGYEKFATWTEVERFMLPKTLFSEGDAPPDLLYVEGPEMLEVAGQGRTGASLSSLGSYTSPSSPPSEGSLQSISSLSPPASPPKSSAVLGSARGQARPTSTQSDTRKKSKTSAHTDSAIPPALFPLFNYILWRIHQEEDAQLALDTFIFLTDDETKRKHAQRFGIRSKSLQEIRYVMARENQEARNRQLVQKMEAAKIGGDDENKTAPMHNPSSVTGASIDAHSDEDEVVLKRSPQAPASMRSKNASRGRGNILDPNQFSRHTTKTTSQPSSGRGNGRGGAVALRGAGSAGALRGGLKGRPDLKSGPIDPDSFSRTSTTNAGSMRGARRLWTPS